ncbi:MAG: hypothetical protein JWQ49_4576 [Edaphobacter sp.]|nr:hypothetical protein [Edaphobacter sp.]
MQISNAGLSLIKKDEGFKAHLYNCPANDAHDRVRPPRNTTDRYAALRRRLRSSVS